MIGRILLGLVCLGASPSWSNEPGIDFELAGENSFVRLAELPPQITLVNFWRHDCPPCIREMPILARLAQEKEIRVVTVALHRRSEHLLAPDHVLAAIKNPVIALYGPGEPRGLLARFGDPSEALPHTVLLNSQRQPCARKTGEINTEWLENAVRDCVQN